MTLNPLTLEEYFHVINQPKEATMFEYLKNKWTELTTTRYQFQPEPLQGEEDYWAFEMHTPEYTCDGEVVPMKHHILMDANDSTWHDVLDRILDVMGEHYGYNIKEQVYYSVAFPMNIEGESGHVRMLNDEVVQKLLLAYPEVYETRVTDFDWKPL